MNPRRYELSDGTAIAAGQAARCPARGRPQGPEWDLLAPAHRIFEAVSKAYDGDLQMIDASSIRVHQHGGNVKEMLWGGRRG